MLSKSAIKYIKSLQLKKFRQRYGKFTAEGDKIVKEILQDNHIQAEYLYCTPDWAEKNALLLKQSQGRVVIVNTAELKKISNLQTPNQVLAVLSQLENQLNPNDFKQDLSLVLQNIQDPGNMGTILRIADWFGIPQIICSKNCVDIYNHKVVQASMGAFLRVNTVYEDLEELVQLYPEVPKYGALLGGKNLFKTTLSKHGMIVIGNESKGISKNLQEYLTHQIEIPANGGAESLNAGVATGIICAAFRNL